MSIEKMREEFEVWAKRQAESVNYAHMQFVLAKHENGEYRTTWVDMAWIGWQASRESLVIELPDDGIEDCRKEWPERGEKYGYDKYDTFDTGYLYACKKHEEAIEAAGLKVKS